MFREENRTMSSRRGRRSIFDLIDEYMEEMESLAEELMSIKQPSWNISTHTIEPLCNVFVTRDEAIVTADLPFSDPDSVTVEPIDERTLEISAKIKRRICCSDLGITHQKGEFSTFNCQTHIPVPVDMKKKKAKFKKGILEVRLPRKKGYEIYRVTYIMLEEDGTDGGAFLYLHSTFLKEASKMLGNNRLTALSEQYCKIVLEWTQTF